MNSSSDLLKKLLPGLLPIFVFILVDEFWSTQAGLVVALVFGIAQLAFVYFREKRIDKFILFDTLLLLLLGGISIALENEIFFKLKPFLINLILCAILGISVFGKKNLIMLYSQRLMGDIKINDEGIKKLNNQLKFFFWLMLAYSFLILYSAFYMSKEAWAFISGALLYIIFGVYFLWQFISMKLKKRNIESDEWLPHVDETGKIIGKITRHQAHTNNQLLHPVVHMHVFNSKGEVFLQKRPLTKDIQPGKWDTAVGGHVAVGENIEQALRRETLEEINISEFIPQPLGQYIWKTDIESELVFSFKTIYNATILINKHELEDGRFWTKQEIQQNVGKGIFTPNFEVEIPNIFKK